MKILQAGLNQQSPVIIYDKTKPYMAGRVFQKTIGGQAVYGPPLTGFINTFSDTGSAPTASKVTVNGRMFQIIANGGGLLTISLHLFDFTGATAPQYVGRIFIRLPNAAVTTHTIRGFEAYDGATSGINTGWQLYIGTVGTTPINGGLFVVNNVALTDFSPLSPPTIEMAIASNAKAVYMAQDPGATGAANTLTAMQGLSQDRSARRLYFHNNVLATTQFAVFDASATPAIVTQAATSPTVVASPTFTMTGHGYAANDPVVIIANAPTAFTNSTASAAQTVYFVRATNLTANTFELSATSGGLAINATSVSTPTFTRAFGTTTSHWLSIRTGTVTGFVGTFLLTNCESFVVPSQSLDSNLPTAVNGQPCLFVSTSTNAYLIKVSEIINGAIAFPSMVTTNMLGNGSDYTAITPTYIQYSEATGRIIIISNTAQFYVKQWINSVIAFSFGGLNTSYLENSANAPYTFAGVTVSNLDFRNGYAFLTLSTVGQRGLLYMDFRSDSSFNYSYLTSPVKDASQVQSFSSIFTNEKLFDLTASMVFSYKTASTSGNTIFNDPTTGWTQIAIATDLSGISFSNFVQFRMDFGIANGNVNTPAQINELFLSYNGKYEMSDNWSGSVDNTTQNSASPAYTAFRLSVAYPATVPTMYFRSYDDAGNLVASADTISNPTLFQYSTNNGTSWNALGTIPNTVGTTEIRYLWATPPGVRVTSSLRES